MGRVVELASRGRIDFGSSLAGDQARHSQWVAIGIWAICRVSEFPIFQARLL